ncbi:hypothetical protein CANARDRAFT_204606, partial [[Candida] arabinofermentans NRRL YB-2248]
SWDDDFTADDDKPVLEAWDAESDDEKKTAAKPAAKKVTPAPKKAIKGKKGEKKLMEIDTLDAKTRAELIKEAELNSDLNNAADLFEGLGVANEHPRAKQLLAEQNAKLREPTLSKDSPLTAHPIFDVETKPEYEKLRKALSATLTDLAKKSQMNYSSSLAIDLIRDLCVPLNTEQTRKVVSTLNAMVTQKAKEERLARIAKTGGTATGGAGKKKVKGTVNLGGGFKKEVDDFQQDDFDDDDFM